MFDNKSAYLQVFGILAVVGASVLFICPDLIQRAPDSGDVEESIDFKIRFSAILLGIGVLFLSLARLLHESNMFKVLLAMLSLDVGYLVMRFTALANYDFASRAQFSWLLLELVIAVLLCYVLKIKKAPSKA